MAQLISRRKFLKLSGGVVGGVAVSELIAAGVDVSGVMAAAMAQKIKQGQEVPSICPYCAVGCGQIVTVSGGKVIDIQGNPDSPINEGTLCPKGAANYQLAVNSNRWTTAKYRAPNSDHWEDISLDDAMNKIAQKFQQTRDANFIETAQVAGKQKVVNHVLAIASLGGATIDDEWNYLHQKLLRAANVVSIENQARI
jgi:formate dehydrogenase major subunit